MMQHQCHQVQQHVIQEHQAIAVLHVSVVAYKPEQKACHYKHNKIQEESLKLVLIFVS